MKEKEFNIEFEKFDEKTNKNPLLGIAKEEKEFNLSDKRKLITKGNLMDIIHKKPIYNQEDVKEFIKRLKDDLYLFWQEELRESCNWEDINFKIDKLAGDDLK